MDTSEQPPRAASLDELIAPQISESEDRVGSADFRQLMCGQRNCQCARGRTVHCPAHEDETPSLAITRAHGKDLFHCHAGCTQQSVLEALRGLGLWTQAGLVDNSRVTRARGEKRAGRRFESARYSAIDENGMVLAYHIRLESPGGEKSFVWERDGQPHLGGLRASELPLYRLPDLIGDGDGGRFVVVTEGEKAADAVAACGLLAVGTMTGASSIPGDRQLQPLLHRQVVLFPDNDEPGRQHMQRLAEALARLGHDRVLMVATETLSEGGDAADVADPESLSQLVHEAVAWVPGDAVRGTRGRQRPPPYPTHVLPGAFRQLVEEGAAALGVPAGFIAVPLFACAGACIGSNVRAEVKPDFIEYPTLWTAVVGSPGSAKSPALNVARRSLDSLQSRAQEAFAESEVVYRRELEARKGDEEGAPDDWPQKPTLEHFYSTDATPEALGIMLRNSTGLLLYRDELTGWVKGFDSYHKGGERQSHLSLWAGSPLKSDRKTAESVFVEHPVVCVTGGIQPDLLADLQAETGRGDGFLDRFLWCYPESEPQRWTEDRISEVTKQLVLERFEMFRELPENSIVVFTAEAKVRWASWYDNNSQLGGQSSGLMQGVISKLPRQLARLALVLHCMEHGDGSANVDLGLSTLEAGIELVEYHLEHAERALAMLGSHGSLPRHGAQSRVFQSLLSRDGDWIALTDIHRGLGGHTSGEAVKSALESLEGSGSVERRTLGTGGRPREEWRAVQARPARQHLDVRPVSAAAPAFFVSSQVEPAGGLLGTATAGEEVPR